MYTYLVLFTFYLFIKYPEHSIVQYRANFYSILVYDGELRGNKRTYKTREKRRLFIFSSRQTLISSVWGVANILD